MAHEKAIKTVVRGWMVTFRDTAPGSEWHGVPDGMEAHVSGFGLVETREQARAQVKRIKGVHRAFKLGSFYYRIRRATVTMEVE
jgi:hypothetical protein